MILYNFHSMNFVTLFHANIVENQLAILFKLLIVEYHVSILRHQHDVVGDLTIAMAKTVQFQRLSHPSHRWVSPPVARCQKQPHFKKKQCFIDSNEYKKPARVHFIPDLKGQGIRDPPRSRSNKNKK